MTTNRWTAEQRAELEKRRQMASRPAMPPHQVLAGAKAPSLPQYHPVGANIGLNTTYKGKCGTCGK